MEAKFTITMNEETDSIIQKLQRRIAELSDALDNITFTLWKKTGSGSNEIQGAKIQSTNFKTGVSGWELTPDGNLEANSGTFRGSLVANSLDIPDTTTANSFHVDTTGNTWWGATTFAGAVASVSKAGAITGSSVTITGGAISGASLASIPNDTVTNISLLECSHDLVFSVTDADTIAWAAGTIVFSNGRTFSIAAGNTGNMAALTYIYLDPAVSSTVLQTTTTYSTAMGANKRLIGTAQNHTVTASFIPYGAGVPLIDGANIGELSIVAGNIAASTITATKLSATQLSGIFADLGTIIAGNITLDTSGYIRGGQTAYNTGTGFFLGYESAAYKFSIGDGGTTYYLTWDGSTLVVNGSPVLNQDIFGDGSDGDVTISVDTSLSRDMYYNSLTVNDTKILNPNGFRIFVKGTLNTVSTGKIASNGGAGGNGTTPTAADASPGGSAGAIAYSTGTLPIPLVGKVGGDGAVPTSNNVAGSPGIAGVNQAKALGNTDAVAGGVGGTSGGVAGGAAGAAGTKTGSILASPRSLVSSYNLFDLSGGTITQFGVAPSSGSGGGGTSGLSSTVSGGGGGGSGASGGVVWIAARLITNLTAQANGGIGGNGGSHGTGGGGTGGVGGGGGGGNGGAVILLYSKLTSSSLTASGGAGGTKGTVGSATNATDGTTGNAGITVSLQV